MLNFKKWFLLSFGCLIFLSTFTVAQDSTLYNWDVSSRKIDNNGSYELTFKTQGNNQWQLYGPNEVISEVPAAELEFDSSVSVNKGYKESGISKVIKNPLFYDSSFKVYEGPASFSTSISIKGTVPAKLLGRFSYTYGKADEFYPLNPYTFSVNLEGGVESVVRIKIDSIDLKNPVSNCGDEDSGGKSLFGIFYWEYWEASLLCLLPACFH